MNKKSKKYIKKFCSFDIETTSTYTDEGEKIGFMYIWAFCYDGEVIYGRTWQEFIELLNKIIEDNKITLSNRLLVFVHNLSFEFQFFRKLLEWSEVFAIDNRQVCYCTTKQGIEFRCSYIESGYSLEDLAKIYQLSVTKLTGKLDYKKVRHYKTTLTQKELEYLRNDVLILYEYIKKKVDFLGGLNKLCITKTAYVRKECRKYIAGTKNTTYLKFIKNLTLSYKQYLLCKRAFAGGYTHTNPFYTGDVLEDVGSYDITSSYSTVMIAELFPMSPPQELQNVSKKTFEEYCKQYCCIFDVIFYNIEATFKNDFYISLSKCCKIENYITSNGRVVSAKILQTALTNIDFDIIKRTYKYSKIAIANFTYFKKSYLPTKFIEYILKLYKQKTSLKGVAERQQEYQSAKENINSLYGMCATDPLRPEYEYTSNEWHAVKTNFEDKFEEYQEDKKRFLYYPWAVFITAYARRNLWTAIINIDNDYVYSDTDSVKDLHPNEHKKFFDWYNAKILQKLKTACDFHNLDFELVTPKTVDGVEKPLGVWDFEGVHKRFKTLGAKRYIYADDENDIHITISGLSKKCDCIKDFEFFKDYMFIPSDKTGKLTHTYIDTPKKFLCIDYTGEVTEVAELSAVHLEDTSFCLSMSQTFVNFLTDIKRH